MTRPALAIAGGLCAALLLTGYALAAVVAIVAVTVLLVAAGRRV